MELKLVRLFFVFLTIELQTQKAMTCKNILKHCNWLPRIYPFLLEKQLETDSNILLNKAHTALEEYKMLAVVANELSTRKEQVVVVTSDEKIIVERDKSKLDNDVESPLIKLLWERHSTYIEDSRRWVKGSTLALTSGFFSLLQFAGQDNSQLYVISSGDE